MVQSQPFNVSSPLVISYQDRDYTLGGMVMKKGYFVSRNGMRITHSFNRVDEVCKLFPLASIADDALYQMLKEQKKQLEMFHPMEKSA